MLEKYTEKDLQNLKEIEEFLNENNIEYYKDLNNFCLNKNNPDGSRSYEIEYIASHLYPIKYEKFNIEGVSIDYFYKKSFDAENNNSFKCWVKDYEWQDYRKREVLKSYFLYAAGKISTSFYARDCEVRVVESPECRKFESENCFYGKRGASLNLGLYLKKDKGDLPKDTLVMVYTFGKNFFGKDNSIEVLRVGTKKFTRVIGGSSKLLKYFLKNYPTIKIGVNEFPVEILKFYSDYDHNIGGSMDTLGFELVGYSKGGFMNYWVETGEVKGRQPNKHKWVMEQMKEGKVFAIPNAGVKTYVMDVSKFINN